MKKKANGFFKFLLIALLVIAFMLVLDQVILIDNEASTVGAELRTQQFMRRFYGIVPDDALPETEWMLLKPESLKKKNEFRDCYRRVERQTDRCGCRRVIP